MTGTPIASGFSNFQPNVLSSPSNWMTSGAARLHRPGTSTIPVLRMAAIAKARIGKSRPTVTAHRPTRSMPRTSTPTPQSDNPPWERSSIRRPWGPTMPTGLSSELSSIAITCPNILRLLLKLRPRSRRTPALGRSTSLAVKLKTIVPTRPASPWPRLPSPPIPIRQVSFAKASTTTTCPSPAARRPRFGAETCAPRSTHWAAGVRRNSQSSTSTGLLTRRARSTKWRRSAKSERLSSRSARTTPRGSVGSSCLPA